MVPGVTLKINSVPTRSDAFTLQIKFCYFTSSISGSRRYDNKLENIQYRIGSLFTEQKTFSIFWLAETITFDAIAFHECDSKNRCIVCTHLNPEILCTRQTVFMCNITITN